MSQRIGIIPTAVFWLITALQFAWCEQLPQFPNEPLPGQCAEAHRAGDIHWVFHNNCKYPVYWVVQCAVGVQLCCGSGKVAVDSNGTDSRNLPGGPWEIDGPYR